MIDAPADDKGLFQALIELYQKASPAALVILTESEGSVPASPGAKMIVTEDGRIDGTVGGGAMEAQVVEAAVASLTEGAPRTMRFDLSESAGYVCGGRASFYIEPILPPPQLVIAGAGHVGQALCTLAAFVGFSVTVADDRVAYLDPELLPRAAKLVSGDFETLFSRIMADEKTFVVCATREHVHDYTVVRAALATPAQYIGLLGSRKKKGAFFKALLADGVDDTALSRIHTPVGLEIGASTPREIAVSIVSQLIKIRRGNV
mgnify:CR=1 FL=1